MNIDNWSKVFTLALDFSSVILLVMLISLVNLGLKWLPARNKISLFLSLFLIVKLISFTFLFLDIETAFKLYACSLPIILLVGPLMTGFTQSSLLMQKKTLLDIKDSILLISGYVLISPFLIYPYPATQLPIHEQPNLLAISLYTFVFLFVTTSSYHFISMIIKFKKGALYSVGYNEQSYFWLKGVWCTMTFIWLSLIHNMISGIIDIPWEVIHISWETIDIFTSFIDISVLFSLTILTVMYCKKPIDTPAIEICEISEKYEKSALSKAQALAILKSIDMIMQTQKCFLDNSLNIEKLAKKINTPSQYLSQTINQYRTMNFYELIAKYRIEYAKEILLNEPEKTILEVAMGAGFNAKSTFNQTFKKITGLTPSQYKKETKI
ncbi:helix-turn-helix domain-containing protein [Pseudoalteromonas denitrificans]|uniref:Helix-turn-helix domain-containing protein n=1 Tax=Pseudoalteromonas denitrificans DSM 6059 TaxID=1123010 RepID=A0A1I1KKT3_9GAMM|nr:helix-turn-helix domain-containing protein [Pseudoalteromonas denitrificans]SFC58733.1 Helix-turn-helix domain-containing protein [Pseudoalteromonas denitrificans DSM 6059]